MTLSGNLGCLDREWRGWVLRGGKLISPAGWEATPQDVLSLPFLRAQLAAYHARKRQRPTKDEPESDSLPSIEPSSSPNDGLCHGSTSPGEDAHRGSR